MVDNAIELAKPGRVAELRRRLSCVSCLMQSLCEYTARRANREDKTRGVFFEDRFKARFLADEASIVVCGIYIDLNQIRAGEALTPEESYHTSAYDRIVAWKARNHGESTSSEHEKWADSWLCELTLQEGPDSLLDKLALQPLRLFYAFSASKASPELLITTIKSHLKGFQECKAAMASLHS